MIGLFTVEAEACLTVGEAAIQCWGQGSGLSRSLRISRYFHSGSVARVTARN